MYKAHKQALQDAPRQLTAHEQRLENNKAHDSAQVFLKQMQLQKKLHAKLKSEGMGDSEAHKKAWEMVRNGSHVFVDLDDEEEIKHKPIKHEIKKHTTINSNINEVYNLVNKALLIINTICSKHRKEKKYENLKKYFEKLNDKVK